MDGRTGGEAELLWMLRADPVSAGVFVFGAMRAGIFAIFAFMGVSALSGVRSSLDSAIAGQVGIPSVAESDSASFGKSFARPLALLCNWPEHGLFGKPRYFLILRRTRGVTRARLNVFPVLHEKSKRNLETLVHKAADVHSRRRVQFFEHDKNIAVNTAPVAFGT